MIEKLPDNIRNYIVDDASPLLDGYIRFLNRDKIAEIYQIVNQSSIWNEGIPFATTVFGDLIVWEDGYVMLYNMPETDYKVMLSGTDFFFENLNDKTYQTDFFQLDLYKNAIEKCGAIKPYECYVIEPIPALGGARELKYLSVGDLKMYLQLLA